MEDRSGEIHDRTRRRLHVPFRAGDTVAARPAAAGRRFRAPDAAVPRPGHVLRPARRRQSRLEAARRDHRRGAGELARQLTRPNAWNTCAPISSLRSSSAASSRPPIPEQARQRDHELIANPTMLRPITPRLGPGLHGDAPPPAGARAAQPRLADGTRLDDRVGYRFAVLADAPPHRGAAGRKSRSSSRWQPRAGSRRRRSGRLSRRPRRRGGRHPPGPAYSRGGVERCPSLPRCWRVGRTIAGDNARNARAIRPPSPLETGSLP